ncbi:MAG: hypothetical protein HN509_09460 [Halobacteriovoraceae bacterium]|jgi:hypothetical protein|nr:hypothetical protein [Halobacteriovoraceae bacterium]MBT5095389.1 hypothetical protein [Halobacteriovoraceae bacterium]
MSEISNVQAQKFREAESKRHSYQLKKTRQENYRTYQKEVKVNENMLTRMRSEYDGKVKGLQNELEGKLSKVRAKQSKAIDAENKRLNEELVNLKRTHADQVTEIKIAQQGEVNTLTDSHKRTLENARLQYQKEKVKFEDA